MNDEMLRLLPDPARHELSEDRQRQLRNSSCTS